MAAVSLYWIGPVIIPSRRALKNRNITYAKHRQAFDSYNIADDVSPPRNVALERGDN